MNIKTKYDVGDIVWYISYNRVVNGVIRCVYIHIDDKVDIEYILNLSETKINEDKLFETKEKLLESL